MRLHYVSSSVLPSRTANAVHVVMQCDALARVGAEVTLYFKRAVPEQSAIAVALSDAFAVDASRWRLVSYHSRTTRAHTVRIAIMAAARLRRGSARAVLTRNLYAAYILGVLQRRPLIYETHDLEHGVRSRMQRAIVTRPWVATIAISQSLLRHLAQHHGVAPARAAVLHDAAPAGMLPLPPAARRARLAALVPQAQGSWSAVCAYFGHLYPGRGIEVIEAMADARPDAFFLVVGGNESDIAARRAGNGRRNLHYAGHVPHVVARDAMVAADILLMPYQRTVSIGVANRDTAAWMSPMKMFEYLASGVPVISSDLPVLREVLAHERNALLVPPDAPAAWVAALDRLIADPALAGRLGAAGHEDYRAHHTWDRRAAQLLEIARAL